MLCLKFGQHTGTREGGKCIYLKGLWIEVTVTVGVEP